MATAPARSGVVNRGGTGHQQGTYGPQPQTPTQIPADDAGGSAQAVLKGILDQWGLGALTGWAWEKITAGASIDQVVYELRQTTEYKTRFAGNVTRQAAGLPPLSEADYLGYEQQVRQMMTYYGLPKGFYDTPGDFAGFIGGDVSVSELHDRVLEGVKLAQSDVATQGAYGRLYGQGANGQLTSYGVGDLAAYYLDETKALPLLQRQGEAAQVAGAAVRTGFGDIDRITAEHLASIGVSADQAASGFGQLAGLGQVTQRILGDTQDAMSQGDQVAAVFDQNATAQAELSRRQRARVAGAQGPRTTYANTQGG